MLATMEIYRQFEALWHAGQDASLHLECHTGQVWLNLQVHLQHPSQQHQKFSPSPKNSPSRQRRRERRKAARTAAADAEEALKVEVRNVAAEVVVPPPKDVHGGCTEQVVPGHGHHLEAHQQQPSEGRDGCECPTAAVIAPPQPFKITQLDGHHSDTDVEDENTQADKLAKLSITNVCTTDIPPDPYPCRFCLLVSELPNYPSPKPTDPVCAVCRRPIDDRFNPHRCCDLLMHENCWGQHRCIGWE